MRPGTLFIPLFALLAGGCRPNGDAPLGIADVQAEVSDDVVTVVTVRWTTEEPSEGMVEFGPTDDYQWTTSTTTQGTEHEVVLLGLPGSTEAHYRIVASGDAGEEVTEDATVTTGDLPNLLPSLEATGSFDGFVIVPVLGQVWGLVVVDGQGRIVWYYIAEDDQTLYSAYPTHDGSGVVTNVYASDLAGGQLLRIPWDGGGIEQIPVAGMRHDIVELPDGTVAAIVADARPWGDGDEAIGDQIVEVAPDGSQTVVWSAWDDFDPSQSVAACEPIGCIDDWSHVNSIDYSPEDDAYYLNLLWFSAIVKVDRTTGAREWTLGGDLGEFTFADEATMFDRSHQFEITDDRLLLFNNGNYGSPTEVDEFAVDFDAKTVSLDWSFAPTPAVTVETLGSTEYVHEDLIHATWATAGMMQNVNRDGSVQWQLSSGLGYAFAYSMVIEDLYAPYGD